jgi:hypothetical protein
VDGSLCTKDLKGAISAVEHGDRKEGERAIVKRNC